jgi:hypothetical protein
MPQPFDVDLEHLMEDVKLQCSIPIEEATIVENMDNFLDERYREIRFDTYLEKLRILMVGSGIPQEVFERKLSTMAGTTKVAEGIKGLGRYGYGMKIMLFVSNHVVIETKLADYHKALRWEIIARKPYKDMISTNEEREGNFTLIEIHLKDEFRGKFSSEFLKSVLQQYYPTVLSGAPVINQYGERRKVKIFVDSEQVTAPKLEYERKTYVDFRVDGEKVSGSIYLTKKELEEESGIAVIVHGRKIIEREYFHVYGRGDIMTRITGYIHADVLIDDIAADKTKIKKQSISWRKISRECGKKLASFLREIGAAKEEEELPKKLIKQVHEELNGLVKKFTEWQEIATSRREKLLISKKVGDVSTELSEIGKWVPGSGPSSGSGEGREAPASPGDEDIKAPSEKSGKDKAVKKRGKGRKGLEIKQTPFPPDDKIEARFQPEGIVLINTNFPTFKKAERGKAKAYHIMRAAIDSIIEYMTDNGIIPGDKVRSHRNEVLMEWGKL